MKYYFPIILQNKNIEPLPIDKNIKIRPITLKEREEFFGIEGVTFDFLKNNARINNIKISKIRGRYSYNDYCMKEILDGTHYVFASNYVVECEANNREDVVGLVTDLNIAFNLLNPTNTKCRLGFKDGEADVSFFGNQACRKCRFGSLILRIDDFNNLSIMYKKIKILSRKEKLKFELFMSGLHNEVSDELKFLSLIIALENIFLPDCSAELKLRFSLRIAGLIKKFPRKSKKDVFELANDIYDIRSKIVHEGASDKLTENIHFEAINLTKISLIEYLKDPNKFKKEYLNNILIQS